MTQGFHIHVLEAIYATIGYNPAKNFTELDTDQIFGEPDEAKKESQVDNVMNKYINPYATRIPANWQKVYLTTFFEIDCEIRQVMVKTMRKVIQKRLKGKQAYESDSDEGSDEDDFVNDLNQHFANKRKEEMQQRKCCSHDHGPHNHHGHQPSNPQQSGIKPGNGTHGTQGQGSTLTGVNVQPQELDQSNANLDTSVDI